MPALSVSDAHIAGGWCLACLASHAALSALLTPSTVPRLSRLSPREQGSLRNTVVAAVHAAIMFVGSASYLAPHWDTLLAPLTRHSPLPVAGNSPVERFYCSLMLGYLVYDTLYGLVARNNGVDMVAHHLVGFGAWVALLLADRGGFYMMWVQLAEVRSRGVHLAVSRTVSHAERGELTTQAVSLLTLSPPRLTQGSTPFLHATTALFKLGLDGTAAYSLCAAATLVTFTLLRMVLQPLCLLSLVQSKGLWGSSAQQQALFYTMAAICAAFNALNTMWWMKLVQRAIGLTRKKKAGAPASSRGRKAE